MRRVLLALLLLFPSLAAAQSQPRAVIASTVQTTNTGVNSLLVGCAIGSTTCTGGIKSGGLSVNGVGIVASDGRIPAISSTYFASLSGANLTSIPETAITDGSLLARVASAETISGQWTTTHSRGIEVNNTAPFLWLNETGVAANSGRWRLGLDGTILQLQALNDAENVATDMLLFARSGTTLGTMTIGASQVLIPGCSGAGCASAPSFAISGAGSTGLYLGSGGGFGFVNGGTTVFSVGTTSSNPAFNISGPIAQTSTSGIGLSIAAGGGFRPLVVDRTGGDGTIVDLMSGGVSQGTISIAGATTAYNTFMGAHYTQLQPGQDEPDQGLVMVSVGKAIPLLPRKLTRNSQGSLALDPDVPISLDPNAERFVYVQLSSRRNQTAVYGVWHADLGRTAAGMSWGDPDAEVFQIAAVGQYTAWVTDTCGPVKAGFLLATSPVPGLAEAQCGAADRYDGTVRDHTLGRSLVDVDWATVPLDADGVKKLRIPVVLKAG